MINFVFSVPTSRQLGADDVYEVFTHPLECAPLKKSATFDLSKEDPQLYANEDLSGFNPDREWKDIPLPVAPPSKPVSVPDEVIEKAKSQHDILVRWMKSLGVDLCHEMEEVDSQHTLEAVANQKQCEICQKVCHNTQRLRAHIRAKHMATTPFQCSKCHKYFSDNSVLKLHLRTHDPTTALAFKCPTCGKGYPTLGRLNDHRKKHVHGALSCKFACGKTFDEQKNLVAHEKYCSSNPQKPANLLCPYCPKEYERLKSLKKHCKTHHQSRYKDLEKDLKAQTQTE